MSMAAFEDVGRCARCVARVLRVSAAAAQWLRYHVLPPGTVF